MIGSVSQVSVAKVSINTSGISACCSPNIMNYLDSKLIEMTAILQRIPSEINGYCSLYETL